MSDEAAALAAMDAVEQGGGAEVSAPDSGQATEPFHSYKWDDGKEDVWNTKDDLNDFIRQGALRHSDYTRKTQQVAESRKLLDQRMKDYEAKERTFNESYSDIMKYDKFLRENPEIKERIAQEMSGTIRDKDLDRLLGEKIKPLEEKLSRYEQEEAKRAEETVREKAYEALSGRYKDFDRSAVDSAIQKLNETPEEMRLEAALEAMYYAHKGRSSIGAIERKVAQSADKKARAAPTPTESVEVPEKKPANREEEMAAAMAAMDAAKEE